MVYKPVGADETGHFPPRVVTALDATYGLKPRNGGRSVGQDEVVYNVLDHGIAGNGTTDDVAAIEALGTLVSAAGGGTIYFPRKTYRISRSIRCRSNVRYKGDKAVIYNNTASTAPIDKGAFVPGYIHGAGFYAPNGAGKIFSSVAISDVALGGTTVTSASVGGFSTVAVGDFVAVRSVANYVASAVEVPNQLYFSKILSISGDTLSLSDASPYAITGATVHPLRGNPVDGQNAVMEMIENVAIEGFDVDALFPVWGGGCYGFRMANIRPANREKFSSLVTLNAMCRFEITDCQADWYYTFCELALGSADGRVHRNSGTYRVGTSIFNPISIVESSHNIKVEDNTLTVPAAYSDSTKVFVNLGHCQDVWIRDNKMLALGTMDAVFGVSNGAVAERGVSGLRLNNNQITTAAGVNRVFNIGGNVGSYVPKRFTVRDNFLSGSLNPAVNEWVMLLAGEDFVVSGNVIPDGVGQRVGPSTRGRFDGGEPTTSSSGHTVTVTAMASNVLYTNLTKTIGRILYRGSITAVRVEVLTAFNAGTSNTMVIGHSAVNNAYATTLNVGAVGIFYVYPGHASAGIGLGKRLGTQDRDVIATYTPTGTAATQGIALVTVYYEPSTPPSS